jgi:hypothetical protein
MILNYKDSIFFPINKNDNQYKRFLKEPNDEFETFKDLWPRNETEELSLNLHHYWSLFQEWWYTSLAKDDSFNQGIPTNELMVKTDFIPIKDYMIKVDPGLKWNVKSKQWMRLGKELF